MEQSASPQKKPMLRKNKRKRPSLTFFGHFGEGNFGNESTLQAIVHHARRILPDAKLTCVCTNPRTVASHFNIEAIGINLSKPNSASSRPSRLKQNTVIRLVTEPYRWLKIFCTLRNADAFIIPGTGLLNDAYGLLGWGPYNLFKWSLIAKICRCRFVLVSVGAGPIYGRLGRHLIKAVLLMADFRSYREVSTSEYLQKIGFNTVHDRVYPDLAFSLPEVLLPAARKNGRHRCIVGIGLMPYPGKYSVENPNSATYTAYLNSLAEFVEWLFAHQYDARLILGEAGDQFVIGEFRSVMKQRSQYDEARLVYEPAATVADVLSQIAATDLAVATRFHNVLLALLLNKPVISIGFHHKCASLMNEMGLSEFAEDIHQLSGEKLIKKFSKLEREAPTLKLRIQEKVEQHRKSLDDQYKAIFDDIA